MAHKNILMMFKERFADIALQVREWFPNGKDSIRVRLGNRQEFIFTYHGDKDWCLETVNSYITHMRGEK